MRRLMGLVLRENDAMLALMQKLGFKAADSALPDVVVVSMDRVP